MVTAVKQQMAGSRLAQMRERFHAWWEGAELPPEPLTLAPTLVSNPAGEEAGETPDQSEAQQDFDVEPLMPLSPRLAALRRLWGAWRISPPEDGLARGLMAGLKLPPRDPCCFLGPGGLQPVLEIARAHSGPVEALEWREEAFAPLQTTAASITDQTILVGPFSLDGRGLRRGFAGIVSLEELAFAPDAERFIASIMGALKGEGRAVIETYCIVDPLQDYSSAFSTSFATPHLRTREAIRLALALAGSVIENETDRTAEHIHAARAAFRRFSQSLHEQADALPPGASRELAWEAEAWRLRLMLLSAGKLQRIRFVIRKRRPKGFLAPPKKKEWRRDKK